MNPTPTPQPETEHGPERVSLVRLAGTNAASSAALNRVVSNGVVQRGPGRVAVAAFQSSV